MKKMNMYIPKWIFTKNIEADDSLFKDLLHINSSKNKDKYKILVEYIGRSIGLNTKDIIIAKILNIYYYNKETKLFSD